MGRNRRAPKDGLLTNSQMVEVKRRARLICDALDNENDEKVEEIAIESIKRLEDIELIVLGELIQQHGFYEVGEAIQELNLNFFDASEDED